MTNINLLSDTLILIQQRHVLNLIGICQWRGINTPIISITHPCDRFGMDNKPINPVYDLKNQSDVNINLISSKNNETKSALIKEKLPDRANAKPYELLRTKKSVSTNIDKIDIAMPDDHAPISISYVLEGVRVGGWVLVVDISILEYDEKLIWASLKVALSNWASNHNIFFLAESLRYPLGDDLDRSAVLAQKCLDGFVMRLCMAGDVTNFEMVKLAFLSDLSDGINCFNNKVALPHLSEMHQNNQAKLTLWHAITAL